MAVPHIPHISPSTSSVSTLVRKFNVGDPVVFSPKQLSLNGNRVWLKETGIDPDALYEVKTTEEHPNAFGGQRVVITELSGHKKWGSGWFELDKNQVVINILNDL